ADGFKYLFQPNYFYNYYSVNPTAKFKINYLVTRLDGYAVADVKAMIDRAVAAKKDNYYWILDDGGKAGSDYDRMMGANPYLVLNNKWAKTVLEQDLGLANYVVYEDAQKPIYSNPKDPNGPIIAYVGHGYYDGCPDNCITDLFNFNLAPGALYSSYESYNALGFHDKDQHKMTQLGEWIAIGGSGGVGNVYEPYANTIANEAIWMPAYAAGYPLADAFYMSLPQLSWNQVVIGDPLTSIRVRPNQPPIITNLTVTTASGQSPLTVGFTAQAQDPDGIIASYFWSFGDGETSIQQNPSHTYNNAGSYIAILTVYDNSGAISTRNTTIVVTSPEPEPTPEPEPDTIEEKTSLLKTQIKSLLDQILILQSELEKLYGTAYANIPVSFEFSKYLKRGSRGDEVKYLQIILKTETDGIFGLKTYKAVKEFQGSRGLIADGFIGPKTRYELNNIILKK
ncbi:MAG: TIGR03790 family protein, partial [bacterium]